MAVQPSIDVMDSFLTSYSLQVAGFNDTVTGTGTFHEIEFLYFLTRNGNNSAINAKTMLDTQIPLVKIKNNVDMDALIGTIDSKIGCDGLVDILIPTFNNFYSSYSQLKDLVPNIANDETSVDVDCRTTSSSFTSTSSSSSSDSSLSRTTSLRALKNLVLKGT